MSFSSFKGLLDGCHLMPTAEAWFEAGRCGEGVRSSPPATQADRPHRLPGSGWGYACNIFSSKWESLQSSDPRLAVSRGMGWGGGQELLLSGLRRELGAALPAGAQGGCVLRSTSLRSQGLSSVTLQSLCGAGHRIPKTREKPRTRG